MKATTTHSLASDVPLAGVKARSSEPSPHDVAELGARFVPQTLRYLGVPEGMLMDTAQDVLVVALRRLGDFEGRSTLKTWLYGICVRVAHDVRRRGWGHREILVENFPEQTAPAPQESAVEQGEWRRTLGVLLDQLEEGERAAFVLFEIQRLSMKEVAEALGCPLQTAYYRHKSAQARVLEAYQRHTDGGEA
jgi:RNA polymerase sigma-70 factor (ECF subfamily)